MSNAENISSISLGINAFKNSSVYNDITEINFYNVPFSDGSSYSNAFRNHQNIQIVNNMGRGNLTEIDMSNAFYNCQNLTDATIPTLWISNIDYTYYNCTNLRNVSGFGGSIWDMNYTFANCTNLVNAPWSLPRVSNRMSYTFANCTKLKQTPGQVQTKIMYYTFANCSSLENTPSFHYYSSIENMYWAFYNCTNLTNVDSFEWQTNLKDVSGAFANCSSLENPPTFPDSVINMRSTFYGCSNILSYDNFSNNLNNMSGTFSNCSSLTTVSNMPSSVKDMSGTFANCSSLIDAPDLSNCTNLTNMYQTFANCSSLENAPTIPNSVINMWGTFYGCSSLENAPEIPNSVIDMDYMFNGCSNLIYIPNVSNSIQSLQKTFSQCNSLENAPDLSNCNNLTNMYETFYYCKSLKEFSTFPSSVAILTSCFSGCDKLNSVSNIPSSVTNMYETFYGCTSLENAPEIPNSVIDMSNCFFRCYNLINTPDLSDCIHLVNMEYIFSGCEKINTVSNIPNNVVNMYRSFSGCENLEGNIMIKSEIVEIVNECFNWTYNDKNVYIPFYASNSLDYVKGYCWKDDNENIYYSKTDFYNSSIANNQYSYLYYVYDENFILLSRNSISYNPYSHLFNLSYYDENNNYITKEIFYDSLNNDEIHKVPGDLSLTYDSFVKAGYGIDPTNRKDGVCLFDINEKINDEEWDYTENGLDVLVTNYKGTNPIVVLPDLIGKNVTFTNSIFNNTKTLIQNVDLNNCKFENDSIFQLFLNASNLDTVSNPNENIIDGFSAFENCSKLVNAPVFSDALIYGARMFDDCRLLEEYTIPNNIQDLDTCFQHCYNLKTVNDLPSSVEKLNWGFFGCSKLTKCPDMSSCTKLNSMFRAFGDCYEMTGSINLSSITGYADSIDLNMAEAFNHCNNATSCPNIPDTAVNLCRVFDSCDKLEGRINVYSTKVVNASSLFGYTYYPKNREIYIPFYEEGTTVHTQTYNSFTGAGYSETTRRDGILIHDLNAE